MSVVWPRHDYGVIDLADSQAAIVPLALAQLCVDCEAIADAPQGCCRACGSRSLLSLKKVLDREEKHGEES